ncbi:LysR family transcriptional regulator [Streptomyces longispororuber]|uniref:LysR family transcriptional regulator n=1 Tax=Streptomyces longispororuber TaxID=68230 RepID=A0A919DZ11_9ACTN|nr:LysR family transcriptional regulator [Streptomyces longispororuber]GHE95489.1 LysR family transcriptional regulator [Streptomyces longispororuber]
MPRSGDPGAAPRPDVDLNLLLALDALLDEGSVRGAARRLHLSEPAMSRTLGRIRKALGDPVLVRAGHAMVPTPYALAVRAEVGAVVERARAVFAGPGAQDLRTVERTLTVVGQDSLAAAFAPALFARAAEEAPGVRLRFLPESRLDAPLLREGAADLEVGVIDTVAPELRVERFREDVMVGVVRPGHPLLQGTVTPRRFAAADHLTVSRKGRMTGPLDAALAERGLRRRVVGAVATYPASLFILLRTDLVGLDTSWSRPLTDALGLVTFPVPLELPPLALAMAWHPRHDADPAHAWLRACVRDVVRRGPEAVRPG